NFHWHFHTLETLTDSQNRPFVREHPMLCLFVPFWHLFPANLFDSLFDFWCHFFPPWALESSIMASRLSRFLISSGKTDSINCSLTCSLEGTFFCDSLSSNPAATF